VRRLFAIAVAAGLAACPEPRGELHSGRGIVRDVSLAERQVVIEHEEIEGLMPAMTMSFEVSDPALLARLEKGQVISFALRTGDGKYRIVGAEVVGSAEVGSGASLADLAAPSEPAADFELTAQDGSRLRLSSLRGRAVLLDFVFTHCPGPCPIQTGIHVSLQRKLPDDVRARTHFVSVSIDPQRDTPEALRAYAEARGADLATWSFLTGSPEEIDAVLAEYGVGRSIEQGEIAHNLVTYLIDPEGRIAKRYLGVSHEPDVLLADLRELAPPVGAPPPG
jgi:protein SCO1/2